jgi:hypothetical protein
LCKSARAGYISATDDKNKGVGEFSYLFEAPHCLKIMMEPFRALIESTFSVSKIYLKS